MRIKMSVSLPAYFTKVREKNFKKYVHYSTESVPILENRFFHIIIIRNNVTK